MERPSILPVHNKPASDRVEGLRSPLAKTFALATVLVPLTAPVAFTDSAEAETTDKILFQSSHEGNAEIYSVNPGGAGLKDLTEGPEVNGQLTLHPVSPDGKRILRVEVQIVARDPAGNVVKKSWRFKIT